MIELTPEERREYRMAMKILAEIPPAYIIQHVEKLGGKVLLNAEATYHCPACSGMMVDTAGDTYPCPGVEP